MQLHPDESGDAVRHTIDSLSAGYIGLDFATDVPDLTMISRDAIQENQRHYCAFAHEMTEGDRVLLFTHHFPFALVRVAGPYNFIRTRSPEIGVWFRHFRKVDDIRYFGDFITNARNWEALVMTATITPLRDPTSRSYQLIDNWLGAD
jgi:hypothetical protein